jgi:hypothetical protein
MSKTIVKPTKHGYYSAFQETVTEKINRSLPSQKKNTEKNPPGKTNPISSTAQDIPRLNSPPHHIALLLVCEVIGNVHGVHVMAAVEPVRVVIGGREADPRWMELLLRY